MAKPKRRARTAGGNAATARTTLNKPKAITFAMIELGHAKDVNDRRFIDRVGQFDMDGVVPEASRHRNACGSGAVAATIAAAVEFGSVEYQELGHTSSSEVEMAAGRSTRPDYVGYHAGIFTQK